MKQNIIEILKSAKKAMDEQALFRVLGCFSEEEKKSVRQILDQLVQEYEVYQNPNQKYMWMEKTSFQKGIFHSKGKYGDGFVIAEGKNFHIDGVDSFEALDGDYILFQPVVSSAKRKNRKKEMRTAKVQAIIKRPEKSIMGEVFFVGKDAFLYTEDRRQMKIGADFEVSDTSSLVDGMKVIARCTSKIGEPLQAEVIRILGHKNDPSTDISMIAYKNGITEEFSTAALQELASVPSSVLEKELEGRLDLRNQKIFTIDGDDTKDIDDAISINVLANGNYQLGVHIADVSYYVKKGSALYCDAMNRGTSVYLADRVIPMLPHQLSNGICSLNPEVDRLALSCIMEITPTGEVDLDRVLLTPSVIRSQKQMTYHNVNAILEENQIPTGYENFVSTLKQMEKLAQILNQKRHNRGAIEMNRPELKVYLNEEGFPVSFDQKEQHTAENLIEEFMIVANESVTRYMEREKAPFIYRIHKEPALDSILGYLRLLKLMGYELQMDLKDTHPLTIQKISEFIQDKKESVMLKNQLLRCFSKAYYSESNIGHSGLASPYYTHFTSPIRRFPDLTVHGLIHDFLEQKMDEVSVRENWQKQLPKIARHSSEMEKASASCEREVLSFETAKYMTKHIGETYAGMITNIGEQGLFVQLDNLIEGVVPVDQLGEDYVYNEQNQRMILRNSKVEYHLGDTLLLQVVHSSPQKRRISFRVIQKLDEQILDPKAASSEIGKVYQKLPKSVPSNRPSYIPPYRKQRY